MKARMSKAARTAFGRKAHHSLEILLYGPIVQRSRILAFHVSDTGSNPVGVTMVNWDKIGSPAVFFLLLIITILISEKIPP